MERTDSVDEAGRSLKAMSLHTVHLRKLQARCQRAVSHLCTAAKAEQMQ